MYDVDKNNNELSDQIGSQYYGQWETDKIIEKYFKNRTGVCVEIGAADGIKGSNTKYFEDNGWEVLCIEPNIGHNESLQKHRKLFINFACSSNNMEDSLHIFNVGKNNITSSLTSLKPDVRLVESHKHIINNEYELNVPVRTFNFIIKNEVKNTVFDKIKKIDFISIDTEGTELDVIKGIDFNNFDIEMLIIENNFSDKNIEEYMNSKGYYKVERYKINDFYKKKK